MTATIETAEPTDRTTDASRLIGVHIVLPPLSLWILGGVEDKMLLRILSVALCHRICLVGKVNTIIFDRQILGFATIADKDNIGAALSAIAEELLSVGLLAGGHLAWTDSDEGIWRTDRPLPEPMPFQNHIEAMREWNSRAQKARDQHLLECLGEISALLSKLAKQPQPPPPTPTPSPAP